MCPIPPVSTPIPAILASPISEIAKAPSAAVSRAMEGKRLEAVVSSLPLFTKPDAKREAVIGGSLARMARGAPFIQFSYALTMPVKPERIGAELITSPWIKRNLPPARVLVYRSA